MYQDMNGYQWLKQSNCFTQDENFVYNMNRDEMVSLNLNNWEFETLDSSIDDNLLPDASLTCSVTEYQGEKGKFLHLYFSSYRMCDRFVFEQWQLLWL